jgi:F0F1-type ATP synthase assembly protein I
MKTTFGVLSFIVLFIAFGLLILGMMETNPAFVIYALIAYAVAGCLYIACKEQYWKDRARDAEKELSDIYTKRMTLH